MIAIGTKCQVQREVTPDMTAYEIGSGLLPVLATPWVAALMENAAMTCLQGYLEKGQGSVGTAIALSHDAPTPVGGTIWAEAEVSAVSPDGRRVEFRVRAWDQSGGVSEGTHTRAVIWNERFLERCAGRAKKKTEE